MNFSIKNSGDTAIPVGDLTIYNVTEFCSSYIKSPFTICDLSKVTKIDTAGFQALLYLKRESSEMNNIFTIINPSADIIEIFNLYGEKI